MPHLLLNIVYFIIVIGLLIVSHEFGHFVAAKLSGVKVLEFAIGFPPNIFSFRKKGTKYSVGLLPLGGYVKMLGEEETSKDPHAFNNQPPGKRFVISVAGVFMNLLLAWLLLSIGFAVGMTPMVTPSSETGGKVISEQIYIAEIAKDSPAAKAGILVGDQIVAGEFDNVKVAFTSIDLVGEFTRNHKSQTVTIDLIRDRQTIQKTVTVSTDEISPIGIGYIDQSKVRIAWYRAPVVAAKEGWGVLTLTFQFLGSFFGRLFASGQISDQVGGPVAIYSLSGLAASAGFVSFIQFIAILSINLGLFNILPFPALDGGRALFIVLEKIFRRKVVKEEIENIIHTIGFALLMALILAITYKDIIRKFH